MSIRSVAAATSLVGACLIAGAVQAHGGGGGGYTVFSSSGSVPRSPNPAPPPPSAETLADLKLKPLVAAGAPPQATAGIVAKDAPFFSVGVRHGVTGVLTDDVYAHGWIVSDKPLTAGQPVYGVPMSGSDGAGIVWCAPVVAAVAGGGGHWTAICLPQNHGAFAWIEAKPAMMTLDLGWIGGFTHVASAPKVARMPVDFPPMTLSYAFGGWNKDHWLVLDVRLDWGEGPQPLHAILVPPNADGAADLHVMQGELLVRPAGAHGEAATIEVVSPPRADAPVAY